MNYFRLLFLVFLFACSKNSKQVKALNQNLPYRDSTISAGGSIGYIDTFTVNNVLFRITHHDTLYNCIIEKLVNNKWEKNLTLVMGQRNDYSFDDINLDGYKDFLHKWKWTKVVCFFDSIQQNFIDTTHNDYYNYDWFVIDSTNKIFCDYFTGKAICNSISSNLYTIIDYKKKYLYNVNFYNCADTINFETSIITKLILNQYSNNEEHTFDSIAEIPLKKPFDYYENETNGFKYFDYKKYWKKNYKKLLSIPN